MSTPAVARVADARADGIPAGLAEFLGAIFEPTDPVTIRPIEIWVEGGRKKAAVAWRKIRYVQAQDLLRPARWSRLLAEAEAERLNLFFGVCPRFRATEGYDKAFQIRVVRVLWCDIDDCTVDEALRRCDAAGLPRPSVIVRSGNGVHLYWLLEAPYLVDDAGDPPPVRKEFIDRGEGQKKKVREYVIDSETGDKEYELPPPSPKALHVQDIIAGIAKTLGGDHTQDLSRLLRLPSTLNRKNQRNGKAPVPCELAECDRGRRYPLTLFERFAAASPDKAEREAVAKVRLPTGRRFTAKVRNRLSDFVNACAAAAVGYRSEPDFALCCHAIGEGLDKELVWSQVSDVGKFGERGRHYFDLTWGKAEAKVRRKVYDRAARRVVPNAPAGPNGDGHGEAEGDGSNEEPDDPHRLARLFRDDHQAHQGLTLRYHQEEYVRWDGAAYRKVPVREVRAEVVQRVKREFDRLNREAGGRGDDSEKAAPPSLKVTTNLIGDVMQALASLTLLPSRVQAPAWLTDGQPWDPAEVLACKNTLVHLPSFVAGRRYGAAPTPAFFSFGNLGYPFDPDAPAPSAWLAFLGKLWPKDAEAVQALREWFGYCLLPDTTQQKILLIVGPKRSGKGTIARVLRALVGIDNTAGPTLAGLGTNFGLWPLLGKTVAIISDARLSGRTDAAVVTERLLSISGEDAQTIDRKNMSHVTCQLPVRFVILTNELPRLNDPSGALVSRMIVLRLTESWYGKEDTGLTARLLGELPGILLWAVEGWGRVNASKPITS